MRKRVFVICIALALGCTTSHGQRLSAWLEQAQASPAAIQEATQALDLFIVQLNEQDPGTQKHLAKVFRKVHSTYLKKYEAYARLQTLFTDGTYDCLTATTLFSEVLTRLNYSFRIIETNYHIFILVKADDKTILLETTDRARGFVTDAREIAKRTSGYRENDLNVPSREVYRYRYRCDLYQEVSVDNLSGLLVFNQAVKSYNEGDWLSSARSLEAAHALYATGRCYELSEILVKTLVARRDVPFELRRACMEHLMPLLVRSSGQVATAGN